MTVARHAVIDAAGLVVNVVLIDPDAPRRFAIVHAADPDAGVLDVIEADEADEAEAAAHGLALIALDYDPGEGLALVALADDAAVNAGDRINDKGEVIEAAAPAKASPDPLDRLTDLLIEKGFLTAADADDLKAEAGTVEGSK